MIDDEPIRGRLGGSEPGDVEAPTHLHHVTLSESVSDQDLMQPRCRVRWIEGRWLPVAALEKPPEGGVEQCCVGGRSEDAMVFGAPLGNHQGCDVVVTPDDCSVSCKEAWFCLVAQGVAAPAPIEEPAGLPTPGVFGKGVGRS